MNSRRNFRSPVQLELASKCIEGILLVIDSPGELSCVYRHLLDGRDLMPGFRFQQKNIVHKVRHRCYQVDRLYDGTGRKYDPRDHYGAQVMV